MTSGGGHRDPAAAALRPPAVVGGLRGLVAPPQVRIEEFLTVDERIYYEEPPADLGYLVSRLPVIAGVVGVLAVLGHWTLVPGLGVPLLPTRTAAPIVAVLTVWLFVGWMRLRYTYYVLTSTRILRLRGVLVRRLDWMPIGRVTDVTFTQNPLERIGNFADVRIHSASEKTGLQTLDDVRDPVTFHWIVTLLVEGKQGAVELERGGRDRRR